MRVVAWAHQHAHSAAGGNGFCNKSAGQEHHLRKEKESFYHNPLPKYIFLPCSFPIWKDHIFSVKDVDTLYVFIVLLLILTLFDGAVGGSVEEPLASRVLLQQDQRPAVPLLPAGTPVKCPPVKGRCCWHGGKPRPLATQASAGWV